jgi:hypothetical protein
MVMITLVRSSQNMKCSIFDFVYVINCMFGQETREGKKLGRCGFLR